MSSSDGRGAAGKAAVAVEPGISAAAVPETRRRAGEGTAAMSAPGTDAAGGSPDTGGGAPGDAKQDDPWFGVARPPAGETDPVAAGYETGSSDDRATERATGPARSAAFDPEATLVDWFLPGGRGALLPESMTMSSDEGESGHRQPLAPAATGVPPWAGEASGSAAGEPPPWENGPWPGPGGALPTRPPVAQPGRSRQSAAGQDEQAGLWTPRAVLVTGLLPLVVPGLVVGLIGLRRTSSGKPGRLASVLAIAASLAWAVVIVVLVAVSTGGSSGGCSYPAAVQQAYATAMADLRGGAPAATRATDLGLAVSRANSAAAAASDVQVRSALFAMAGDLQQARTDVIASRSVPASLREQLVTDGAALTASCPA